MALTVPASTSFCRLLLLRDSESALSLSLSLSLSRSLFLRLPEFFFVSSHNCCFFGTRMKFCDQLHCGVLSSLWSVRSERRRRLWMLLEMLLLLFVVAVRQVSAGSKTRGISPQDLEYFDSATIWCKDGTKSFPRERLNDNFCDCADGTDEPGTSACLEGKFYCKDTGITPRRVFSSRVNDGICGDDVIHMGHVDSNISDSVKFGVVNDCCDGSDEYEKRVKCTNQCKGPKRQQHTENITTDVEDSRLKGLVIKLKDMKGPLLLQMLGLSALFWWQCVIWVRVIHRALSKKRRASHTSFL